MDQKKVFEGVNHNVLMRLTNEKKTTTSNYLYFWSYGRISSCFWGLPPFIALFLDHSLRTTDPNFMFMSIFHNVLRCLINQNHENIGLLLNNFRFLGKYLVFFYSNEKQAKIMDPERVQNFAIKHRTKNVERRCIFCD